MPFLQKATVVAAVHKAKPIGFILAFQQICHMCV